MKPERFARLKKLLLEASDFPEDERRAYLDQACPDDPELRRKAELFLTQDAEDSAILKQARKAGKERALLAKKAPGGGGGTADWWCSGGSSYL